MYFFLHAILLVRLFFLPLQKVPFQRAADASESCGHCGQIDRSLRPNRAVVAGSSTARLSSSYCKIRKIVSHIEDHHFEVLKVKHADGRIESMFLPMKDDSRAGIYNEIVPGTSITANMLSYLTFNRFQMSTPAYRQEYPSGITSASCSEN